MYIAIYKIIFKKLGAEFAKARCRIRQVPNLTSAEFAFSAGAEFDRCRVVLYPFENHYQDNDVSCKAFYTFFVKHNHINTVQEE